MDNNPLDLSDRFPSIARQLIAASSLSRDASPAVPASVGPASQPPLGGQVLAFPAGPTEHHPADVAHPAVDGSRSFPALAVVTAEQPRAASGMSCDTVTLGGAHGGSRRSRGLARRHQDEWEARLRAWPRYRPFIRIMDYALGLTVSAFDPPPAAGMSWCRCPSCGWSVWPSTTSRAPPTWTRWS